jgi:hypothetical protein
MRMFLLSIVLLCGCASGGNFECKPQKYIVNTGKQWKYPQEIEHASTGYVTDGYDCTLQNKKEK